MKRGLVLDYRMLKRLTDKPDYENIVVGTGALARDMRQKLLLLGLKAPFLIGDRSEPEKGIWHYREIAELKDPKRYRFIMCCDVDEWEMMTPAQMAAYTFLGNSAWNHPQVIPFCNNVSRAERAGTLINDAMNGSVTLRDNRPYTLLGDEADCELFRIHITGNCHVGGVFRHTPKTIADFIYVILRQADFRCAVYSWSHPSIHHDDNMVRLIRDIGVHECDLLIFYSGLGCIDPLAGMIKNNLGTRAGSARSNTRFIGLLQHTYNNPVSNGIDHDVDLFAIRKTQQRVFSALSRLHGFTFWDLIAPSANLLSEDQAHILMKANPGYIARKRKMKNTLLSVLDKQYTKDYTDIFGAVDNIQAMFADALHLSDEGNRFMAERLATEILEAFGKQGEEFNEKIA